PRDCRRNRWELVRRGRGPGHRPAAGHPLRVPLPPVRRAGGFGALRPGFPPRSMGAPPLQPPPPPGAPALPPPLHCTAPPLSAAIHERQLPYVEACQLLGFSSWRTAVNHLLRNVRLLILAQATITLGYALLDLAAISFIGLGVQPPTADWGVMVSEGDSALLN